MKLSEKLRLRVEDLWKEAAEKTFVVEMAKGTLADERFRSYMIQDYLYLLEYIDLLKRMLELADSNDLKYFLEDTIKETEKETYRVHVPNMKEIGISEDEIRSAEMAPEIKEYLAYMKSRLNDEGLIAGLTAMLQCSWVYAYIGETLLERFPAETSKSPYKSWFDAYACKDYQDANQKWIDFLDSVADKVSPEEEQKLGAIFETCAGYENRFWDSL